MLEVFARLGLADGVGGQPDGGARALLWSLMPAENPRLLLSFEFTSPG
jgi:hypothetical protein